MAAIVLIAINPNKQIAQARDTVRQADINTIQKVLEQYLIDNKAYPISISTTPGYICNTASLQTGGPACTGFVDLKVLVPNYIAEIPKDPQATGTNTGYIVSINPSNNKIYVQASLAERRIVIINSLDIVTSGLVLNLDAGNTASYPGIGTTWTDLSGNGNNGTLVNGVGYTGSNGGSLVFDGVDDYVNLASASSLPVGTTDRTIFSCVRTPTSFLEDYLHVIHWGTANTSQSFGLAIFSNGGLNTHPWSGAPSQGTVVTGTNYCLAVSYTNLGTLHKFWINGASQGVGISRAISTGNTEARIGSRISNSEDWGPSGRIYNVMVYNRSLTDVEIQQNFNATRGRFGL